MGIMQDNDGMTRLGTRHAWGGEKPFGLSCVDRRQHVYVVGKSGTGKTTLLRNLILQDIDAGQGIAVIDPHGDLAFELLDYIPPHRTDDVVYFNPADQDYPIGFNLLQHIPTKSRHLVASGIVSVFKSLWRESWGPRLEYILYASVAALLECENVTLLGIQRMLVDERYRSWVVKQVKDPVVRSFWLEEFAGYDRKFASEAISPILNKVGQLLMAPPIRNILGQVRSKIEPRFMMDHRRILIANLAKGRLGEDKANLLGAVLVTQFQLAAMGRADVPEEERGDFSLVVDEFHNFLTESFASILSESRKYRLALLLAGQYISQVPETIRDAVFGNVGTLISFRVGEADAVVLAREFGMSGNARLFAELGNHEVVVKLLNQGQYGDPFLGRTLPPEARAYGRRDNIIQRSREKYTMSREDVEDKIRRWLENGR